MTNRSSWLASALALAALAFFAGCGGSKPEAPVEPPPLPEMEPAEDVGGEEPAPVERDESVRYVDPNVQYASVFRPIHFEFNKYRILPEARVILEDIAELLKENPKWRVLIEGHCDERGTNEYNLTLGEQRAQAARRYLGSLGVADSRFQTISYGEERPVDPRHNEEAWAKNRRAEFRVEAPGL
jgi:peptidoglycan-associated lipoprotein